MRSHRPGAGRGRQSPSWHSRRELIEPDMFPPAMDGQRDRLLRALLRIVQAAGKLGVDHRKFGVRPEHDEAVGRCLFAAVRRHVGADWTGEMKYGRYVSVETRRWPRVWRFSSMANALRPGNTLDLHVRAVGAGWVSSTLVDHVRPGDLVKLGRSARWSRPWR